MNTFKELLPIFGILITALFGLLAYAWQEKVKRQTELRQRKEKLYEQLVRNFVDLLIAKSPAQRSKLTTEIERGWLFASDDVLKASYAYLKIFDRLCCPSAEGEPLPVEAVINTIRSNSTVSKELGEALAVIFLAMRRDIIRPKTKIPENWAKEKLQFYKWGALAQFETPDPTRDRAHSGAFSSPTF